MNYFFRGVPGICPGVLPGISAGGEQLDFISVIVATSFYKILRK